MGDVYWGLHAPLAAAAARLGISWAVETGSFYGIGALQLSALFEKVWSIERSEKLHDHCAFHFSEVKNLTFVRGDSANHIRRICAGATRPYLFVLDAHWFPSPALKDEIDEPNCVLLSELSAIQDVQGLRQGSVILIDDADMYLGSLNPTQFRVAEFPSIATIIEELSRMGAEYVDVFDDVIVAGPRRFAELADNYKAMRDRLGAPGFKQVRTI